MGWKLPPRLEEIQPFLVMDILARAQALEAQGREVIHLEIGEPDGPTPEPIVRAAAEALRRGETHYTHAMGLPELREAIARHYRESYGVEVEAERVLVTSGTSPAMLLALSLLLEPGDEAILTDPHYACYPSFIRYLGATPRLVRVGEEGGFELRAEALGRALGRRTRVILINSPANPTGTLLSAEAMAEVASFGVPILSDEIYHGLVYGERERSILEFAQEAFVINGFSKRFAMTGWRLGYLIAPRACMRTLEKLQQNFFISPNPFVQRGGIAALEVALPEAEAMRRRYDERRKFLLPRLRALGFRVASEPRGAFYIFAGAQHLGRESLSLAQEILESVGVAVAPGADFGPGGEGYLRFSYSNSIPNMERGVERLARFVESRERKRPARTLPARDRS
ncbi:MAG: pyridoxal phosphate-dependent aminotransferase [Nitrospinota bacterium]